MKSDSLKILPKLFLSISFPDLSKFLSGEKKSHSEYKKKIDSGETNPESTTITSNSNS